MRSGASESILSLSGTTPHSLYSSGIPGVGSDTTHSSDSLTRCSDLPGFGFGRTTESRQVPASRSQEDTAHRQFPLQDRRRCREPAKADSLEEIQSGAEPSPQTGPAGSRPETRPPPKGPTAESRQIHPPGQVHRPDRKRTPRTADRRTPEFRTLPTQTCRQHRYST